MFAYSPMQTVEDMTTVTPQSASFKEIEYHDNSFEHSDIYFETDDHTVIPVDDSNLEARAILCTHVFKSGYADVHNSKSNGGCEVKRFTAKICQKCNHLVIMDYVSTTTYAKCPHK